MEDSTIEQSPSGNSVPDTQPHMSTGEPSDSELMKRAVSEFVSARVELASIEAKEAAGFAAQKLVFGIILGGCAILCWLLLLAAVIGWLAGWADTQLGGESPLPGWAAVTLALAAAHGLVGVVFLILLKKKPTSPLFELTKQEIENDKAWVKNKT